MRYTAGELANKLGVSARTVRFYEEKKILLPCEYSESGYRIYDDQCAERLQKILMLRYLDFSIEQIQEVMQVKGVNEVFDVRQSLKDQEEILAEKKEHIERILEAVKRAQGASNEQMWENLMDIIKITKKREDIVEQYQKDNNLNKRISIHQYSTAKEEFYYWMFQKIELKKGMKILEIGCGNASFWKNIAQFLPEDLEIHLTDYSSGMLESAKRCVAEIQTDYPEKKLKFIIEKRDAMNFSYPVNQFDRIMANHVLYYIEKPNRMQLYQTIQQLLAPNGRFSCSLIGKHHNRELNQLIKQYYPQLVIPLESFDIWLETAQQELQDYFSNIQTIEQENDLLVPNLDAVVDYVCSFSEQAKQIITENRDKFVQHLKKQMNSNGYLYIHKSTGLVLCQQN